MSVEKIQLLHEDYIRLTERFKALWTFHQFVRGVYKTFFSADPGYALDFTALYDEVKAIASQINTGSPENVDPAPSRFERPPRRRRAPASRRRPQDLAVLRAALLREGPAPGREDRLLPPALLLLAARRRRGRHRQGRFPRDGRRDGPVRPGRRRDQAAGPDPQVLRDADLRVRVAAHGQRDDPGHRPRLRRARHGRRERPGVRGAAQPAAPRERAHDEAPRGQRPLEPGDPDGRRVVQPDVAIRLPPAVREGRAAARRGDGKDHRPRAGADARRRGGRRRRRSSGGSAIPGSGSTGRPWTAISGRSTSSS